MAIGLVERSEHEAEQVQQGEQEDRQQHHGDLPAEDEQNRVEQVVSAAAERERLVSPMGSVQNLNFRIESIVLDAHLSSRKSMLKNSMFNRKFGIR